MSIQWVLPSIDPAYREECLAGLHPSIRERTLVIDNSEHNIGVSRSWNLGIERAERHRAEWLVILSESVRFGDAQGIDLEEELRQDSASQWVDTVGIGWHLIAFRTRTLTTVGRFDENFPAYLEDTDYLIRLHLAGLASPRENDRPGRRMLAGLAVWHTETEHSIRAGLVHPDLGACRDYYRVKWGADEPKHRYTTPFDLPGRDWTWWPEPPQARTA